jgi:hypothetical protein
MAFKLGSTAVIGTTSAVYTPPPAAANGLFSDGTNTFWSYPGTALVTIGATYLTRTIMTHGFMAGGYKGSNPWRSVNKTWHANDITYYCGEQLDRPVAYTDGVWSDYNGYIFGGTSEFAGTSTHTSSVNLHNGIGRTRGRDVFGTNTSTPYGYGGNDAPGAAGSSTAGQDNPASGTGVNTGVPYGTYAGLPADPDSATNSVRGTNGLGGWEMSVGRDASAGGVDQVGQHGYVTGGGSSVTNRLHFGTEIMYIGADSGASANHGSAGHGELAIYCIIGGSRRKMTFSSQTWAAYTSGHTDGICKILSAKQGHLYGGTGANVTSGQYKFTISSETSASMTNKLRAMGEENFQMGQNWGYCLGNYDDQQNNHTVKYTYSNDAQLVLGSAARPKGHTGQSSAAAFSAAASITATYYAGS